MLELELRNNPLWHQDASSAHSCLENFQIIGFLRGRWVGVAKSVILLGQLPLLPNIFFFGVLHKKGFI